MSQLSEISTIVAQAQQAHSQAKLAPVELRAKIAEANANRVEAVLRELNAYKALLEMGALPQEDFDEHEARLIASLKPEEDDAQQRESDDEEDEIATPDDSRAFTAARATVQI